VAAGVHPLPMSQLGQRLIEISKDPPVLLVFNTQNRSSKVAAAAVSLSTQYRSGSVLRDLVAARIKDMDACRCALEARKP
jgi:hypothetical protein